MEPVIREAYEMLTGNKTRNSGFWTIQKCEKLENPLIGKLGASPDAIVLDDYDTMIGICEFKAPVHVMYNDIPKQYLIQMHAQMAVTGMSWCDFMAVCVKTKSIMLKRVYFCQQFWSFISQRLLQFCSAYLEMSAGDEQGADVSTSKITTVKQWTVTSYGFPHQSQIPVTDLLTINTSGKDIFIGPSEHRLTFDLLVGSVCTPSFPEAMYHREIEKVDQLIDMKDIEMKYEGKGKVNLKGFISKVESKDGIGKVETKDGIGKVESKDGIGKVESKDGISKVESMDVYSNLEFKDVYSKVELKDNLKCMK
ncbi:hypothetical protein ACF0H5_013372 [Mactra antiquata]